ncbi:N-acetylglucosamine-1-phosphodiester alpha-N-acetylglucosaminidase [Skeletonema marinoi]|uniref:N-acetylglucosamine-1-phosphodiester alpha-N-acetylglucosaminidase n=1 Tax=Skeletonema marinoi TaxID=267567 RepID=A0AAD8XT92_9STRA|nr:N-acetylglucosamine-1-phosphodiester alpha-N-acetylglucosaminidase [Skeletonema marinoi]
MKHPPPMTWLSLASAEIIQRDDLNNDIIDVLRAFGRDDADAPGPANLNPDCIFCTDEKVHHDAISHLQNRIATELLDEIDADQAQMFGRRFASISSLLRAADKDNEADESISTDQLLRLALHRRTVQILSTTDVTLSKRKALRVRAVVDFIWSQSLVLGLADSQRCQHAPTLVELVEKLELHTASSSQYNEFHPGFYHATLEGITRDYGPVHINILRINLRTSKCRMKCLDARESCTDLSTLAQTQGAVAAISGGFFLYSEPDIEVPSKRTDPVGLLVSDGQVCLPPVFRRAAIMQRRGKGSEDGLVDMDKIGMDGVKCILKLSSGGDASTMQTLELVIDQKNVKCIHRGNAEVFVVAKKDHIGLAIVGKKVVAVSSTKLNVPLAGFVLSFPTNLAPIGCILDDDDVLITVQYGLPFEIYDAMAGGPLFFSDIDNDGNNSIDLKSEDFRGSAPPVTFSQDETFDRNLLPRMGVGTTKDGELCCVAVDGRNLDRALGLTLQGTSDLLKSLGCTKAMNLDGGSSKRMVLFDNQSGEHKVVCLSTTEIKANTESRPDPSRPVHSAILFLPPRKS